MKKTTLILCVTGMGAAVLAGPAIGTRVAPPSRRDYTPEAIREAGERGGMLLNMSTNFTAGHNRAMGDAMELWNAHRWDEGVAAFRQIWQGQPQSPWAAEAELHEACYLKYNARYDEAEERFLSVLNKYPNSLEIQNKVLRYLPHLYAQTGRYQTGLDLLEEMKKLPLGWQERQYIENYARIFARAKGKDDEDRLCGTKALALALAAQNDQGETFRNVSLEGALNRQAWSKRKSTNPEGFSLQELADLDGAQAIELDLAELRAAAEPGHPIVVHLKSPKAPKSFTFFKQTEHPDAKPLSGHFVVVEKITGSYVDLLDPDLGRTRWPLAHFQYRWSGTALRLAKQNNIHGQPVSRERAQALRGGCCGSPPPDPSDESDEDEDGDRGCGAPIYLFGLSSANLVLKDIPMWSTAGKGPKMAIQLIYNRVATQRMAANAGANYYAFGDKWSFNFFSYLTETPNSGVDIVLPGGKVQRFDSTYASVDIWNRNTLTRTNDHFVLEFHDSGNKWYYNTNTGVEQHLEKIEDKYGDALTLQYDNDNSSGRLTNIVDALTHSFRLSYNASGYVANVADSFGRNAHFGYQDSDLISLTDMGGLTTTIQYDENHWPTNITYPSMESWSITYTTNIFELYPGNYWVAPFQITVKDPLGQNNEYLYTGAGDYDRSPVTVRDKAGNSWLYGEKQVGGSSAEGGTFRTYYQAVNAQTSIVPGYSPEYRVTGHQWARSEFDLAGNQISVATANSPYETAIQWVGGTAGRGNWTADVLTTNLYDERHNLLSTTVLTNVVLDGNQPEQQLVSADTVGTWTNWYDARDNRLGSMNPLNQVTRYAYDASDRLLAITNTLNQVTRLAYDAKGNLTNLLDALNRTNRWTYDANGRNYETFYADGLKISKGYDTVGRLGSVTNHGSGLWLRYNYDDLNRMRDVSFPDGTSNHFEYSCCGLDYTKDRLGRFTLYSRDAIGRTTSVTDPANRVTGFGYNGADEITRLTTTVGGESRTKKFDYTSTNGASRLTKVTTPMGKLIRYDYTFRGGLAWRQDGNGRVTKFQYDPLQRLVSVTDANDVELVGMGYDVLGNVTRVVSTNSVFEYRYDALNRATNAVCLLTNIPGFATTVKYKIDYAFDPVGNVTNRVITGLQGMSGTNTTRYQYDVMNRLTNVVQLTNGAVSASAWYAYDTAGRLGQKGYGNGDLVTHGYDVESRLLTLGITNGTTAVQSYGYQWDAGGNILAITNIGGTSSASPTLYAYDAAGQLTNEVSTTETNAWQYDEAGNWIAGDGKYRLYNADNEFLGISDNSTNAVTVTGQVQAGPNSNKWYHTTAECKGVSALVNTNDGTFSLPGVPLYPGTNALVVTVTDVSGNSTQQVRHVTKNCLEGFAYDNNGNLTNWNSGTANWSYEWDWADRLTKVSSNSIVVLQNWYDAFGRRVAKQEVVNGQMQKRLYLYAGWNIVGVMNENGQILETFTRGVGLAGDIGTLVAVTHHNGSAVTPGTYYIHHNHRGDVIVTRNGTTTTGTYDYSAFGSLKTQTGTDVCRFKFSSKEREASCGFSYYGVRFYAPQWQRWPNHDPIGERGGINLYDYVGNNPINFYDPLGLWTFQVGVTFALNWGWGNFFISAGITGDTKGNINTYTTGGAGAALEAGIQAGVTVQVSNAKCNKDLSGPFGYGSAGGGLGPDGSVDAFWGNSPDGPVVGLGGTFGVGAGAGANGGLSGTTIRPLWP
jgi:RHS repeat-associated protein